MTDLHIAVGVAVIALNLLAAGWGGVAWAARRTPVYFWYVLRAAQGAVIVEALLGALLLVAGREPADGIHYMYGATPVLVNMFAEGMRTGAAQREIGDADFKALPAEEQRAIALRIVRREMGIMALAAFLVLALGIRAAQTGGDVF